MATVVLVHGIAQEQRSADSMEAAWQPALAGGVRTAGHPGLADRLWRAAGPGDLTVRMAYYGDFFLDPSSQGGGDPPLEDLPPDTVEVADQLAQEWLRAAASYAGDRRDRATADRELHNLDPETAGRQGVRAALRPAMNGLSRLRWFAPFGVGLAGRFVYRAVTQVARYLTDPQIRVGAQDKVLNLIDADTRLVIGHSLGSVVAYEALHRNDQPTDLLTLGSPLGLRSIVYDRLQPRPPQVPACVTGWDNLADHDDLVAAHLDLTPFFPPAPGRSIVPVTPPIVDNGSHPHEATHYLTKRSTGRIIARALHGSGRPSMDDGPGGGAEPSPPAGQTPAGSQVPDAGEDAMQLGLISDSDGDGEGGSGVRVADQGAAAEP